MKIDIEGSEVEVMPDLILSGAIGHVDLLSIEWHPRLAGRGRRLTLNNMVRDTGQIKHKKTLIVGWSIEE